MARLIGEARSRQRRRRLRLAWGAVAALLLVIGVREIGPVARGQGGERSSFVFVAPAALFSEAPYMGVNCPFSNSIVCDRVGLAVWLRHPATHVTATIAGQPLVLDWFGDQRRVGPVPARTQLDGYLRPAHITTLLGARPSSSGIWVPDARDPGPSPLVRFWITYPNKRRVRTELRVPLSAGWG